MSEKQKQIVEGWSETLKELLDGVRSGTKDDVCIYDFFRHLLSQQQLEVVEKVKEILELHHQTERLELLNSDNKSSTKENIQKGFEIYKEKLLQSLSTLTTLNNK